MKKLYLSRIAAVGLILLLIFSFFTLNVVSASQEGSVTIILHNNDVPISNTNFRLYRVADDNWNPVGKFKDYPVQLKGLDSAGLTDAANTLAAYVANAGNAIQHDAAIVTDDSGTAIAKNLSVGIYLVVGDICKVGNTIYLPQPFLVSLPIRKDDGSFIYDVITESKYDLREEDETLERSVLKIWNNDDAEKRPSEITVQLLRNGKVYDQVTLNAANNWRHHWYALDAAYNWQIIEKDVPEGYTVAVSGKGVTFTVTNTYNSNETPENPSDSSVPTNPTPPGSTGNPPSPTLPQTGQLWWPVPLLALFGALLLSAGILLTRDVKGTNG